MLVVASVVYVLLTPWKELALVRNGNGAAGLALAGAIVGLAIPIASTLASSVSLIDLVIWGAIALLLQLIAYRVVDMLLRDIPKRIEDDEAGAAIVLIAAKLASALILAAGLWDPALQRF
jgi:putative membrane protein